MTIQMKAEDFFNAYLVLKENNEVLIEKLANSSGKTPEGTKYWERDQPWVSILYVWPSRCGANIDTQ